jgi:hypothetical protein
MDFGFRVMMTEAYLDLPNMIKYYGEGRPVETETDDLSERSSVVHLPLNFDLVSGFSKSEDLATEKVLRGFFQHAKIRSLKVL